jgi:arsenite methyltransferase
VSSSPASPGAGSARYGIDRPFIAGLFAAMVGLAAVFAVGGLLSDEPATSLGPIIAMVFFAFGFTMVVRGSKVGKPRIWRRVLDGLELRGDEDVLDVGCGRGLVLIEAAKRLTTGAATGIDIWRTRDQTGNSQESCEANAEAEGVADRVEVLTADATSLPFDDGRFDLVLASLSLGTMPVPRDREKTVDEMIRVLRPGGRIVVLDVRATDKVAALFQKANLVDVVRSPSHWSMYPPAQVVSAYKKGGQGRSRSTNP